MHALSTGKYGTINVSELISLERDAGKQIA
jgi:hypothetical protein